MKLITLDDLKAFEASHEHSEAAHIKPATEWTDDVVDYFFNPAQRQGDALPWSKALGNFDLRPAETTLWLGFNGHGKSLMQGQIMSAMMMAGKKVLIASMEMRPVATLARMCRQASGGASPSVRFIQDWHRWTDGKLWLYDQNGTINVQRALTLARYSAEELRIDHFVLDSLMKCTPREDDFAAQKELIDGLCCCARDTGMHIHVIHHSRKQADESQIPGKMDAKGSGIISDMVDNVASVFRVKNKKDEEMPDAVLAIDKQRHGEWEGKIGLWFHAPSQQYVGVRGASPMSLCDV